MFEMVLGVVAVVAGATASVAGFGIGSLLTPTPALETGTKLAVATIAIPYFIGTLQRFLVLRRHVDRSVLFGFGIASACGGLAGALVHTWSPSRILAVIFGFLLVFAAVAEFIGWMEKVRWGSRAAWLAGALSGAFGGLVGNQGSIRSAALLGFRVPKESFVATATAIALVVDAARLPVYLATQWTDLVAAWRFMAVAAVGVVLGTALGVRVLGRLPQAAFRRVIAVLLFALGTYMMIAGGNNA